MNRKWLEYASYVALLGPETRNYRIGAVGIRSDGAVVEAYNGHPTQPTPKAHAEARLCRKIDKGATVYVVRVGRDNEYKLARPCVQCFGMLRAKEFYRIYYSISEDEYGVIGLYD